MTEDFKKRLQKLEAKRQEQQEAELRQEHLRERKRKAELDEDTSEHFDESNERLGILLNQPTKAKMSKEEYTANVTVLKKEVTRLQERLAFVERERDELQHDIQDYRKREEMLLKEVDDLESNLSIANHKLMFGTNSLGEAKSVEDFLHPKVNTGTGVDRSTPGFETGWGELVYAYTDKIFIDADTPDLLLFRDDDENCYRSPTNSTRLMMPVKQEDLDRIGIIEVRNLTDEEVKQVWLEYQL